jgi:hypothetical protein
MADIAAASTDGCEIVDLAEFVFILVPLNPSVLTFDWNVSTRPRESRFRPRPSS